MKQEESMRKKEESSLTMSGDSMETRSNEKHKENTNDDIDNEGANHHHARHLLQQMPLKEQIAQMAQIDVHLLVEQDENGVTRLKPSALNEWIGEKGVGSVLNFVVGARWTIENYRQALIQMQTVAQQHNRPPILYGIDSVHGGNYFYGAAVTPQAINLAATFNKTVATNAGVLASRQTRAAGITWLFSPLLGISLEPKWSRVYETFGEDPYVVGIMAEAMVQGIQAVVDKDDDDDDSFKNTNVIPTRAAACAKHFVGYSKPINGHDRAPSWIPTRHLYQYFVPPWKRVAQQVLTVMESYTEIDGVPNVANAATTDYLLRQRLQFDGLLVTDYQEMENLHTWHRTANSLTSAVQQALRHGTADMSMLPDNYDNYVTAVQEGLDNHLISLERIAQSAERILQLKHDLRMLQEDLSRETADIPYPHHERDQAEAMDMVRQSIILTKNENNALPLPTASSSSSSQTNTKVLITGPTGISKAAQSGGWTGTWQGTDDSWFTYGNTVLGAFSAQAGWDVSYRCGVDILGKPCDDNNINTNPDDNSKDSSMWNQAVDEVKDWVGLNGDSNDASSIARAAHAASSADVVVIALGEEPYAEKPGDIRSLRLPEGQYELVRQIHASAKNDTKIVLVYFGGRPRLLGPVVDLVDAALIGFLPGPSAGDALTEIVTGHVNPSARLPLTYPLYEDGGGIPYFHSISDQCTSGDPSSPLPHWQYTQCEVQWPFGHGLSYTTFAYSDFVAIGGIDQDLQLSVTVQNTGQKAGADAVLFFTFDEFRQTTPEYKRLRAFDKVYLEPGEKSTVKMTVPLDELRFVGPDDDTHYILDPHQRSWVGVGASTDCRTNPADDLCTLLQANEKDVANTNYVGACEAACDLWKKTDCWPKQDTACYDLCTSISQYPQSTMDHQNQGWGWNYVHCLESVVYGMSLGDKKECWRMTSLCRDVLRTGQLDRYGSGPVIIPPDTSTPANGAGVTFVALLAGLLSSAIIILLMRGYTATRGRRGEHPNTEFVRVGTHEVQ